ncbi:MAG: GTPase, partial [Candidatus Thermoplasmatota archaeon]
GFGVRKTGDATVGLVGFPSVGKSTLLNRLTGAKSEVAYYNFTTLETIPGILKYKGADIQILDLPGLIQGASKGKGRGQEVLSAVRSVDLILFMIDVQNIEQLEIMYEELHKAGLRLNEKKPDVKINKTGHGGIKVASAVELSNLSEEVVKSICSEYITNANVNIREDITEDQLIDVLIGNRLYVPALVLLNKIDLFSEETVKEKKKKIEDKGWKLIPISATEKTNLKKLKETIFSELRLIRVYMKPVGEQADMEEPLILKEGDTIEDACFKLHRDFKKRFRYAIVSGPSAKHENQNAGLDHKLQDGDILTIVIKK